VTTTLQFVPKFFIVHGHIGAQNDRVTVHRAQGCAHIDEPVPAWSTQGRAEYLGVLTYEEARKYALLIAEATGYEYRECLTCKPGQ
jgi:hypothetical protein